MSSPIQWNSSLAIGVGAMDDEHKKLIALMEKLYQAEESDADFKVQAQAFKELVHFTKEHFEHEEAYMEKIGYADLEKHKRIHVELLRKAVEYYNAFIESGRLPSSLFDFLNLWLLSHIKGIDAQYADATNSKAA